MLLDMVVLRPASRASLRAALGTALSFSQRRPAVALRLSGSAGSL